MRGGALETSIAGIGCDRPHQTGPSRASKWEALGARIKAGLALETEKKAWEARNNVRSCPVFLAFLMAPPICESLQFKGSSQKSIWSPGNNGTPWLFPLTLRTGRGEGQWVHTTDSWDEN